MRVSNSKYAKFHRYSYIDFEINKTNSFDVEITMNDPY